jgi:hypothetical protein
LHEKITHIEASGAYVRLVKTYHHLLVLCQLNDCSFT